MGAEDRLREGDLEGCLAALQDEVRGDPSQAKLRVFLFQLLSVLGQWDRARTQLEVAGDLDASTLAMVSAYRELLASEPFRAEVFRGGRTPLIFGDPAEWVALLIESLKLMTQEKSAEAGELRERAFEAAPTTSGTITVAAGSGDETKSATFEWIADADSRLGPMLEAVVNGKYYWVPFENVQSMDFEGPVDLRDMVWTPVFFTWTNGGESPGFIPTRYAGTETDGDAAAKLARSTQWTEIAGGYVGSGQRILATDSADYPLLNIRRLEFATASGDESSDG